MIKLMPIVEEIKYQQLEEGWKENILAAVFTAASIFGGEVKAQNKTKDNTTQISSQPSSLDINISNAFSSGRYLIRGNNEKKLVDALEKIGNYIAKNPSLDYKIKIISSESQVPNYDAEQSNKVKLEKGDLAKKRAEVAKFAVTKYLEDLKKQGIFKGKDSIESELLIGNEKFIPNIDNKDDIKYTKDQFIKIIISANTSSSSPKLDKYNIFSDRGESIFMNGQLKAIAFYATRKSDNPNVAGVLNTGYQPILLRIVKPDTPTKGNKNETSIYIQDYIIPSEIWNSKVGTSKMINQNLLDSWGKYKVNS